MRNHAFLKALTFRIAVVTADFLVLMFILGSAVAGGEATLIRHVIQVLMYWYHERVWSRIGWEVRDGVESTKRALVKTLTYRLFASGKDFFVIVFFAGSMERGIIGTLIIAATNSVLYYLMERAWIVEERWEKEKASEAEA